MVGGARGFRPASLHLPSSQSVSAPVKQKVKSIYSDFQKNILDKCINCINITTCSICMATVGRRGKFCPDGICENYRTALRRNLKDLYNILESNPTAFDVNFDM